MVEDVVVIAAEEAGVAEGEQEVDDLSCFGAAVDVVADEEHARGGVYAVDEVEDALEGPEHAVDVADDPAHREGPSYAIAYKGDRHARRGR